MNAPSPEWRIALQQIPVDVRIESGKKCYQCGAALAHASMRFCTPECRVAFGEKVADAKARQKALRPRENVVTKPCASCGKQFRALNPRTMYCPGGKCRDRNKKKGLSYAASS